MRYRENDSIQQGNPSEVETLAIKYPNKCKRLHHVLLIVATSIIALFLSCRPDNNKQPGNVKTDSEITEIKKDAYISGSLGTLELIAPLTNKPILIKVEWRKYEDEKAGPTTDTKYLVFYDPLEKTVVKEIKLGANKGYTRTIMLRTFSNHRTYLISSQEIYELDTEALEVKMVNKEMFAGIAQAQNGLESLKFTEDGDGLELVTSEEETIYYFPIINKTYTAEKYDKASHGFNTLLPGAKQVTYHHFTQDKNEYSGYKLQLLKIKYLDNGAGPKTFQKFFLWTETYVAGQGYVICMVIPDLKEYRRITSFKDLTPGRNYYKPMVVYEDGEVLLIRFKANATDDAPYKLQRLNINTGEVIWTAPLAHGENIKKLYRYKNGYYAFTDNGIDLFDLDGTSIDHFKNQ